MSAPEKPNGPWRVRWPWEGKWRIVEHWPDDSHRVMPISVARAMGARIEKVSPKVRGCT